MTNDLTSAHARRVLDQLLAERATALGAGLAHNVMYMDDLEADLEAAREAYVGLAVTEIATLRGKPTFVATSHAAWSSFSVRTSRTTMTAPSRSIVQPACLAVASSADRCSPSSNPSGKVTSNSSDPAGRSATRQA
jgi:electron transfer flavoprotein alpha subunit